MDSANDSKKEFKLPKAMPFAWIMRDVLDKVFYGIAHNDLKTANESLNFLKAYLVYLRIAVFKLADESDPTYGFDGINENFGELFQKQIPSTKYLYMSENEKEVAETVINNFEMLTNDIGSVISMMNPLEYQNVQKFNGVDSNGN